MHIFLDTVIDFEHVVISPSTLTINNDEENYIKNLSWDTHWDKYFLEKCVAQANRACDEVVMSLFKVVYFQEKKYIHSYKFASLYEFFVSCKTPITKKLYYHGKIYVDMMFAIYTIF